MKLLPAFLLFSCAPLFAEDAAILHYWDMDTLVDDVPTDVIGGVATTTGGGTSITVEDASYGSAYTGSGSYLKSVIDAAGGSTGGYLLADVWDGSAPTAMVFAGDFSFSYWSYDDHAGDGDIRGPRVFDCLSTTTTGIQLGSNLQGIFNYRMDDDAGNEIISNQQVGMDMIQLPQNQWTLVTVNVDRGNDIAEVFFDGVSQGTYDISSLTGTMQPTIDLQIGCINGANGPGGIQTSGLDDLAFYQGLLSARQIADLLAGGIPSVVAPPPPAPEPPAVGHYWDFDTLDPDTSIPVDTYGSLPTSESGFVTLEIDLTYGEAYAGSGWSLNSLADAEDFLKAATFAAGSATALDFGTGSFAFSYWSYDATDGDPFGAQVFDCLLEQTTGVQVGTDSSGNLNLRIDDDADNSVVSNLVTGFENVKQTADQWVHVVINVDRTSDELTIYFDGTAIPEGAIDISSLTGSIFCTQNLEIGVRNGGGVNGSQANGLDDLAIYPDVLTQQQITDLAGATTTPTAILDAMQPVGPIEITDVLSVGGKLSVTFESKSGSTYSVYGGSGLADVAGWSELTTTDLVGDDSDLTFSVTPPHAVYFLQVRED